MIGKAKTIPELVEAMASLPQGAAAWLVGVSPRTLRDRQVVPRNADGTYNAQDVVLWHLEQLEPVDGEPMLSGSNSPALERFRAARADREELELAVRREQLLNLDDFLAWFDAEVMAPIRKNLDTLQRKHGEVAFDLVTAGLQKAQDAISQRFET